MAHGLQKEAASGPPGPPTVRPGGPLESPMSADLLEQASITLVIVAALLTHMAPTVLAFQRSHPQKFLIAVVNLLPGIGWFAGLALLTSSGLALRRVMVESKRA